MKKLLCILLSFVMLISAFTPMTIFAENDFSYTYLNNAGVHDPSIYKDKNGKYYIVGSHMVMYNSDDMMNWTQLESSLDTKGYLGEDWKVTLAEPLKWTTSWQEWRKKNDPAYADANMEYNCWANDVIYNEAMGKYCLYGAVSVWGSTCSGIWLCTSDNIEGPYKYVQTFIYTGITNNTTEKNPRYNGLPYTNTNVQTDLIDTGLIDRDDVIDMPWFIKKDKERYSDPNDWWYKEWIGKNEGGYACGYGEYPNAIDPAPFIDENGDMWLVYGSYSGGCFVQKLNNKTGLPDYEYMKNTAGYDVYYGKRISNTNAETEGTGEGPYIQYDAKSGYYYFFLTYGGLDKNGGYNIREYRSKNPDGPYVDAMGNDAKLTQNTGLQLDGNYQFSTQKRAMLSGGHSSCLVDDDSSMYQVYHQRYVGTGDAFNTVIHKMARTENGWSVLLPFQYQGEKDIDSISLEDAVGVYEFVDTTNKINNLGWNTNQEDIVAPTQTIALNEDGTISNVKSVDYVVTHQDAEKHDIKGYVTKEVTGTWKLKNGTAYVNFKIGNVNYSGVFAKQYDETENKNEVIVFSCAGDNNSSIWGVKSDNHSLKLSSTVSKTCTANGYDLYSCDDCNITLKKNIVKSTGHTCTATVYKPTCAKQGYTKHSCKYCSYSYTDNKKSATGKHSYNSGKVTKKATYASKGSKTVTCTVCNATAKVAIDKKTLAKPISVKITAQSKGFKLSWKKNSSAKGYEIQYSTNSSFKSAKKVTITKNSTVSSTVKKLTGKKKYYVRVRTYVTENGKKYYSSWVKTSVRTKK